MRTAGAQQRPPGHRTLAWSLAAGLLLVACSADPPLASLASLPASQPEDRSLLAEPTASAAPIGPPTVGLDELEHVEVKLAGGPDWPTLLDGSLWVLAPDGPQGDGGTQPLVYRLDAASGDEQARVPIGGRLCQGIVAALGMVWACTDTGLARIDPAVNAVVTEVPFATAQVFVRPVVTEGRIWMLSGNVVADQLVEIDPASNQVVATHPLGHVASGLAAGEGALWATAPADGLVLRIEPTSGDVTVHAEGLPGPGTMAVGAGSLWVALYTEHGGEVAAPGEPTIARLSTGDGSVQAGFTIGTTTMVDGDIWADEDAVWVRSPADPFLVRLDPASDQVVYAISGFHSGGSVTVGDGVVWTTSIEFATAWRIEP